MRWRLPVPNPANFRCAGHSDAIPTRARYNQGPDPHRFSFDRGRSPLTEDDISDNVFELSLMADAARTQETQGPSC